MAKGEKKVSINAIDNIIGERFVNTVSEQWYGVEVNMKHSISFMETLAFVDDVVKSCFQKDGTYVPEVLDFAIKSNIINRYTNVSLPDNLEHRYTILYNSDLVDFICKNINMPQLQEIISAANRKLSYMCESNTALVQNRLNELVSAFEDMQKKTEDVFKNITPEDMAKLASALGDAGMSEDKVVEAYLRQTNTEGSETDVAEAVE